MKKTISLLICLSLFATSSAFAAQDDDSESCWQKAPERSSNPLIELLTFPMKIAYVMTLAPRCIVTSIPKNDE